MSRAVVLNLLLSVVAVASGFASVLMTGSYSFESSAFGFTVGCGLAVWLKVWFDAGVSGDQ